MAPRQKVAPSAVWLMLWLESKPAASVAVWRSRTEIAHNILLKLIPLLALSLNSCLMTERSPLQEREFFKLRQGVTSGNWKVTNAYVQWAHWLSCGLGAEKYVIYSIIHRTMSVMCLDSAIGSALIGAIDFLVLNWGSGCSDGGVKGFNEIIILTECILSFSWALRISSISWGLYQVVFKLYTKRPHLILWKDWGQDVLTDVFIRHESNISRVIYFFKWFL